jgi:molecular chaperone DnaJ
MSKHYYAILGVTSAATVDEVKAAYRRRARAFHPDHYSGGLRTFLDIQEAYSVLGDPARRRAYDRQIAERTRAPAAGRPYVAQSRPDALVVEQRPADLEDISLVRSFETFAPSFDEIFDWLWSNFRSLAQPKAEGVRTLSIDVPITPEQALRGGHARIFVPARASCPTCRGYGVFGPYECPRCVGEGIIAGEYPVFVAFPSNLPGDHAVLIPLDRFGIRNMVLSVNFRITAE